MPLWFFTVHSASFYDAMGLLFLEYIVAECWFGPVLASLYKAVPKEVQGTAQGLFTVLTAVGNLMPVLIGSMQKDYPIAVSIAIPTFPPRSCETHMAACLLYAASYQRFVWRRRGWVCATQVLRTQHSRI